MRIFLKLLIFMCVFTCFGTSSNTNNIIVTTHKQPNNTTDWILVAENVETTIYNAVPEQCGGNPSYTASSFKINLNDVYSHKIIAMEKTFMKKLGLKFGDVIKIEGTGKWDGVWQIQDLMSSRFAGKKKIDLLIPSNIKTGYWKKVKLYCLKDKSKTNYYKNKMAPPANKKK